MTTILNQSEYDNGQVLTDVKLQTINEQLFGDALPNSAAEPHVNTDGQQDIGTQTNRWRHGNFSDEVRTGNNPSIGTGLASSMFDINSKIPYSSSTAFASLHPSAHFTVWHLSAPNLLINSCLSMCPGSSSSTAIMTFSALSNKGIHSPMKLYLLL